jgi:endonuclease/exonuclease/phosphatase family metal-dependent hydrolase
MRRVGLSLLVFSLLSLELHSVDTIKVLTHNVLAFSGHPKQTHPTDPEILRQAIGFYASLDVDVLVLQECPSEEMVSVLAEGLGFNYTFFVTKGSSGLTYPYGFPGAILSRFPMAEPFDLNVEVPHISDTIFRRHMGSVLLHTDEGNIQVTGVHLCSNWGGRNREVTRMKELEVMMEYLPGCDSCIARIVAGDFNSLSCSDPYDVMIGAGYMDTQPEGNYPTVSIPDPTRRIDYIFVKANGDISYEAVPVEMPYYERSSLYLSDHLHQITQFILH